MDVKHYMLACLLGLLFAGAMSAQAPMSRESRLADRYFSNGEYDKAVGYYKKLFYAKDGMVHFYQRYFECLSQLGDLEELDKMVNKAYRQSGGNVSYLVDLGHVYAEAGEEKLSQKHYTEAIRNVQPQQFAISSLASRFIGFGELGYAEQAYQKGRQAIQDASLFNFELAYLYSMQGRVEDMLESYLSELYYRPGRLTSVQSNLQRFLSDSDYELLEGILLRRSQRESDVLVYQQLLVWMYMNMHDFEMAFIQARSMDIHFGSDGRGILELARAAARQEAFDVSVSAYQYLMDKGPEQGLYVTASLELINVKRDRVLKSPFYTREDLQSLEASYRQFLDDYRQEYTSGYATVELARLEAFHLHNTAAAITLLSELLDWPRLNEELEARAKLDLGDYFLLQGEHWESTLLYGQVEKAFRGSPLGEDAKLRNARLSYYKGDFEWAKTQLDILKASTSELISNDAIELSVFIADNLNLDTTDHTMFLFARADLLVFQNKLDEAVMELEGLLKLYPNHSLTDDVYFKRAEIAVKRQQYEEAVEWLRRIVDGFNHDLLTDNALFMLGDIYLNYLQDEESAMAAYETLILDFNNSTFVVDARKRFRKLRGDVIN